MSNLLADAYVNQKIAQRKAVESASSVGMTCNILHFLDASPMTLFEGAPSDVAGRDRFRRENLNSLVSCVIAANDAVRRLATHVAEQLSDAQVLALPKCPESQAFKLHFWRLTYVPRACCACPSTCRR